MLDELRMEDIADEQQRSLAELIGIENYKKLVEVYGSSSIYIYKRDGFLRLLRDKNIKAEFKGDYRELARKYNLSEVAIRNIVGEDILMEGQIKLHF